MFEKFPSIEQYRHIVKKLSGRSQYAGKDDGKAIYDKTKPLPTINFMQTVKIHGTNGGVILFKDGTIRTQSRNRVLSPESDNNGFDKWVAERSDVWRELAEFLFSLCKDADKIVVYGEFAGENIQKNVAVSQTAKAFYVFDTVAFKDGKPLTSMGFWRGDYCLFELDEHNIYSILQFPHHWVSIDLNRADEYIPQLQEIALAIENECPVGKFHGVSGIGEGAVFTAYYDNKVYRFKVKGEKHSASKVKLLPTVDSVMIKDVREFVKQTVTENRLQQGIDYMNEMQIPTDVKHIGDFIRWVVNDVHKEESDIIETKGFEKKLVNQEITKVAKRFYFEKFGV
ncbi:MAG: RNA ligase family protein [Moraxella sp.]|nr:RNA ligase family protein [Moraxella sp.]